MFHISMVADKYTSATKIQAILSSVMESKNLNIDEIIIIPCGTSTFNNGLIQFCKCRHMHYKFYQHTYRTVDAYAVFYLEHLRDLNTPQQLTVLIKQDGQNKRIAAWKENSKELFKNIIPTIEIDISVIDGAPAIKQQAPAHVEIGMVEKHAIYNYLKDHYELPFDNNTFMQHLKVELDNDTTKRLEYAKQQTNDMSAEYIKLYCSGLIDKFSPTQNINWHELYKRLNGKFETRVVFVKK